MTQQLLKSSLRRRLQLCRFHRRPLHRGTGGLDASMWSAADWVQQRRTQMARLHMSVDRRLRCRSDVWWLATNQNSQRKTVSMHVRAWQHDVRLCFFFSFSTTVVTCEIKLFWNNFEITVVLYFTRKHVWNYFKIISAAEIISKLWATVSQSRSHVNLPVWNLCWIQFFSSVRDARFTLWLW